MDWENHIILRRCCYMLVLEGELNHFQEKLWGIRLLKMAVFYFCWLIPSCLQMNCDKHSPCSSNLHWCYIQLSDKLNNSRFFIESFLWTLRGQTFSWLHHKQHFTFSSNITNGSDSALAWVCTVIDHRRRNNVIRTSVRLRLVCHFYFLSTFWRHLRSYWTDTWQHVEWTWLQSKPFLQE